MAKILTVYFSLAGQTIWSDMSVRTLARGNTSWVAEYVHDAVGGDLFEIETEKVYPEDHFELIDEAKREQLAGERPALKALPSEWESYDTVFLGYPNWWAKLPMPVVSFIEALDWSGKRVFPFVTSEGSGVSGTDREVGRLTNAPVGPALSIRGSQAQRFQDEAAAWALAQLERA